MPNFTPERRAELLASAERKRREAESIKGRALLADLTPEQVDELMGLQFTYTLTADEYRAQFD